VSGEYCLYKDKWLAYDTWSLYEACYLIQEEDPHYVIAMYHPGHEIHEEAMRINLLAESCADISLAIRTKKGIGNTVIVLPIEFTKWAHLKGIKIPDRLYSLTASKTTPPPNNTAFSKHRIIRKDVIKNRVKLLVKEVINMFDDPMNIPYGGKKSLEDYLLKTYPAQFTKPTFKTAWKLGKKSGGYEVQDVEKYKSRN